LRSDRTRVVPRRLGVAGRAHSAAAHPLGKGDRSGRRSLRAQECATARRVGVVRNPPRAAVWARHLLRRGERAELGDALRILPVLAFEGLSGGCRRCGAPVARSDDGPSDDGPSDADAESLTAGGSC